MPNNSKNSLSPGEWLFNHWRTSLPKNLQTFQLGGNFTDPPSSSFLTAMNEISGVPTFPEEAALPRANRLKQEAAERAAAQWQNDQNLRRGLNTQQGISDNTVVSPEYLQSTRSKEKVIQRPELGQIRMPSTSIQSGLAPGFSGVMPNWVNDRTGYGNQMGFNLFMTEPFLGAVGERWLSPVLNRALAPVAKATGKALAPVGNYLTTKTPLKNAWKLNPNATKLDDVDILYRWQADNPYTPKNQTVPSEYTGRWFSTQRSAVPEYMGMRPGSGEIQSVVLPKGTANLPDGAARFVGNSSLRQTERIIPQGVTPQNRIRVSNNPFDNQPSSFNYDDFVSRMSEADALSRQATPQPNWLQGYKPAEVPAQLSRPSSILDPINNTFNRFGAFLNESRGEILRGKANRKAIAEGNTWLKNWINHPETQRRIAQDMALDRSTNNIIYTNDDFKRMTEQAKNFVPRSSEFPLMRQLKYDVHSGNRGTSYLHDKGIAARDYILSQDNVISKSPGTGSWISRSIDVPQSKRASIAVHEGTHDWVGADQLQVSGQFNDLYKGLPENIKKLMSTSPQKLSKRQEYLAYVAEPTEQHARIMQLRKFYNLEPGQPVTTKQAEKMLKDIVQDKTPITSNKVEGNLFAEVLGNDPKKLAYRFNRLWALPPAVGGAALLQNQN